MWSLLAFVLSLVVFDADASTLRVGPPPAQRPGATAPAAAAPAAAAPAAAAPVAPAGTVAAPVAAQPTTQPAGQPAAAPPPPPAAPAAAGIDTSRRETEVYGDRLDALETDVGDLKDRIFRSKARLALLKETVLHGVMAGSRVVLLHRNVMGSQFRLVEVRYKLDGAQIFARRDESSGALDEQDEITVFDGNLVPGPHTVTIEITYRGRGFGVFSYLNGYTFGSRSSHSFTAPENGALRLVSVGYEKGNMTTEMSDRPAVDWQTVPLDASGKPRPKQNTSAKPAAGAKAGGSARASGSAAKGG